MADSQDTSGGQGDKDRRQDEATMLPPADGSSDAHTAAAAPAQSDQASSQDVRGAGSDASAPPQYPAGTMMAPLVSELADRGIRRQQDVPPSSRTIGAGDSVRERQLQPVATQLTTREPTVTSTGAESGKNPESLSPTKSSWDLKIRCRSVAGAQVEGVSIQTAFDKESGTGVAQAFVHPDAEEPEYLVRKRLAAGAMGVVYSAVQTSLNRELVIKTMNAQHPSAVEEFVSEAVVTANLVHPNIVPIHDLGRTADGKLFYSMKHVTGNPWSELLEKKSQEENLDILLSVCDAIAYAHSRGVIHCDLKPENVMIGDFNEVVVLDWGTAVTTEQYAKRSSILAKQTGVRGTPGYMAPEMCPADASDFRPQSDVYLLGAILFELLEDFPPHLLRSLHGLRDEEEQYYKTYEAACVNAIEEQVTNTGELMQIARKAMETDPADRYGSVEEFQKAIREYRTTGRAEALLEEAATSRETGYEKYQQSVALFSDASAKWPNNERAIDGELRARQAFAQVALRKGDFDLGLELVGATQHTGLQKLARRLRSGKRLRWWLRTFAMLAVVMIVSQEIKARITEKDANSRIEKAKEAEAEAIAAKNQAEDEKEKAIATAEDEKEKAIATAEDEKEKAIATAKDEKEKAIAKVEEDKNNAIAKVEKDKNNAIAAQLKAEQEAKAAAERAEEEFENERKKLEIKRQVSEIDVAYELRQFQEVLELSKKALSELELSDQVKTSIEGKLRAARQKLEQMPLKQEANQSAISRDGSTVVVALDKSLQVFVRDQNGQLDTPQEIAVRNPVRTSDAICVSANGAVVSLAQREHCYVWKRDTQGAFREQLLPKDLTIPEGGYGHCVCSVDEQRLYLVGDDPTVTIQILDLSQSEVALLTEHSLYKNPQNSRYGCAQFALLPDESAMLCVPRRIESGLCRAFSLTWQAESPQPGEEPQVFSPFNNAPKLDADDVELLQLSPTGDYLVIGQDLRAVSSSQLNVLQRTPTTGGFPFDFAQNVQNAKLECATEKLPELVTISADGTRIAAALSLPRSNIQIWDLIQDESEEGQWKKSEIPGLHELKERELTLLNGHSSELIALEFIADGNDQLFSVGEKERTLCFRDLNGIKDYQDKLKELKEEWDNMMNSEQDVAGLQRSPEVFISAAVGLRFRSAISQVLTVAALFAVGPTEIPAAAASGLVQDESETVAIQQGERSFSATYSEDGERILVGADDLAAHVFRSSDGRRTMVMGGRLDVLQKDQASAYFLEGHNFEITRARFIPTDGSLLLTSENLGEISVWDARSDADGLGYERSRLLTGYATLDFAVSADGQWVLAGGAGGQPQNSDEESALRYHGILWRVNDLRQSVAPEPAALLEGEHQQPITAVAISGNSGRAVTCGRRGTIVVWSLPTGPGTVPRVIARTPQSQPAHEGDGISGVFFAGQSETEIVTAGADGRVLLWSISGEQLVFSRTIYSGNFITRLEPSPDGLRFALTDLVARRDETSVKIQLHDLDGKLIRKLENRRVDTDPGLPERTGCSWSADGKRLMHIFDGRMTLYDTSDWSVLTRRRPNDKQLTPLRGAFSPDVTNDDYQVVTLSGRQAHLWQLPAGKHLAEFRTHHSDRIVADFSADRKYVVTASETLRVFDADEEGGSTGKTLFRIRNQDQLHPPTSAVFSPVPEDYRILTTDRSGSVRLWNWDPAGAPSSATQELAPGKPAEIPEWADIEGIERFPHASCWSQDGRLAAAVRDGELLCWDLAGAQPQKIDLNGLPQNYDYRFTTVTFSRTANLLTAAGIVWSTENEVLQSAVCLWKIAEDGTTTLAASLQDADYHTTFAAADSAAGGISAVCLDLPNKLAITGGEDSSIRLWALPNLQNNNGAPDDAEPADLVHILPLEHEGPEGNHRARILTLEVSSAGKLLSSDANGLTIIWGANTLTGK